MCMHCTCGSSEIYSTVPIVMLVFEVLIPCLVYMAAGFHPAIFITLIIMSIPMKGRLSYKARLHAG